tara:strand:+ start:49054 stop:49311 length:258 start_codon:yes stop_codon:yes gene_type:complete
MENITIKNNLVKVKKTFDLFGKTAYIVKLAGSWECYLEKEDESFGSMGVYSEKMKDVESLAIDRIKSVVGRIASSPEKVMTKILK